MGGSHGGSGDGVNGGGAADPCRLHVNTGGEDIEGGTEVGELGAVVGVVGGTNGDGVLGRGGGVLRGIGVVVTGSDDDGDTGGDGGFDSRVEGSGERATERHGEDGLAITTVLADKFDAANDAGVGAGSLTIEDLDSDKLGLAGNTVGGATDGTGTVSAVSVLISILRALNEVLAPGGTALEFLW